MKHKNYVLMGLFLLFCAFGSIAQTSKEYTVAEASDLVTDIEAGTYDEYILSTSGGVYDVKDIDLAANTVVKAKDGLAAKPILSKTDNTSTYTYFFDNQNGAFALTIEGLAFDGSSVDDGDAGTIEELMSGAVRLRGNDATVSIKDCEFYNFTTTNGVVRMDKSGNAITMDDSYIHDCKGRIIRIDKNAQTFGAIKLTNTTIANVTDDPVLHWIDVTSSTVSEITVENCTFYNIGDHVFKLGQITGELTVSNSIFDAITGGITFEVPGINDTIEYSYVTGIAGSIAAEIKQENIIATAPVYADAANLDLTLQNAGSLIGTDGNSIGDARWVVVSSSVEVSYTAQTVTNAAGQQIVAKSNKDAGSIYFILDGEAQSTLAEMDAAVAADKGVKATVSAANADVNLLAEGLTAGTYYGYAVDGSDNISTKGVNAITVLESVSPVAVSNEIQAVTNAKNQVALVQSNKPTGTVYIVLAGEAQSTLAEIHVAIAANKADSATVTANDTDMEIPTDSLMLGMYYAYAVDVDGNISAKGTNAITVSKGAPEVYAEAQTTSDAADMFVSVQSSDDHGKVYIILDGVDQDSIPEFEAAVAAGKGAVGMVSEAMTDVQLSTTDLAVGVYYAYANDSVGNVSAKGSNKITVVSSTAPFKEYAVADLADLENDITAGLYEYYILSTSGGLYDFSSTPDISKSATIMAKPGLVEKPILKNSANTASFTGIFRVRNADDLVDLTIKGVELDCEGDVGNVLRVDSKVDLKVIDCYIHGNTNSNGSFRLGSGDSKITLENCFVADCKQRVINLYSNTATYGDIVLKNSTFVDISGEGVVYYRSSGGNYAGGTSLMVDHCTFSEIGGDVFRYSKELMPDGITVQNSLFDQVLDSLNVDILDYNYLDVELLTADAGTNTFTTSPVFVDSANYDYGLTNSDAYVCGDGETVGDLTWYIKADSLIAILYPQKATNLDGDVIKVQANVSVGTIYLVREDIEVNSMADLTAAVSASKGNSASISAANTDIEISVTSLYSGNYFAYVVGENVIISSASSYSAFVYDWLNIQYEAQTVTNGVGKKVVVNTSVDAVAYLVKEGDYEAVEDLDFAVSSGRGIKANAIGEEPLELSVEGLQVGTYYGYAVSDTSVSLRAENAITIETAIYVDSKTQTATNTAGAWAHVYVQAGTVGSWAYLLNDSVKFETLTKQVLDEAVANNKAIKDSVKIAEQNLKLSTVGLEPGNYHFYLVFGEQVSERSSALVKVRQPKRYFFTAEQSEEMRQAFYNSSITTGDEVILTSSGGIYNLKTYFRIYGGVTLRAQEGLAEKPVLLYNPSAGGEEVRSFMPLIEFYPPGGLLHIKGIEFDGGAADALPGNATFATRVRETAEFNYGCAVVFDDCNFHDFNTMNTNSSGVVSYDGYVFRKSNNTVADSLVFNNCIVKNVLDPAIYFRNTQNKEYFNLLKVENSTFNQVPAILNVSDPVAESNSQIVINHCTLDSIGSDTSVARIILPDMLPNLKLSNSLITNSASQTMSDTALIMAESGMLKNCNFFKTSTIILAQQQVSNTTYLDPDFYDRADFNYAIQTTELLSSASDGKQVGDLRWEATNNFMVNPDMLFVNSTTLKVMFNQPVDSVTAKVATNYVLSGTVGLTGSPESVKVVSPNAVEIRITDFTQAIDFSTVIVTVSNVINVNGNNLLSGKDRATYTNPIAITMDEQIVGNEPGQVVTATCGSDNSTVYLVPEDAIIFTVDNLIALEAEGLARKATVTTSMENAEIDVADLEPGIYYGYAVDALEEQWSARSENKVTIKGFEVNLPIQLGKTNADGVTVIVQSSFKEATVYLVNDTVAVETESDLQTAVSNNDGASAAVENPFANLLINVGGINAGKYRAYAVWNDSISAKSGTAVQINQYVNVPGSLASDVKIYAYGNKAFIEMNTENDANVQVYSLTGRLIKQQKINSTLTEIQLQTGLYVLKVSSGKALKTRKVIIE